MQPIDPMMNQAVWSRVMATENATECGCPTAPPACPATITAEQLLAMMQDEKNDCATYRYLSCKACGNDARMLKEMAADEACHFKTLHAMYFLMTGKCVCMDPCKPACTPCLTEALRMRYQDELHAAMGYEAAAAKWPDMAKDFRCMAAEERGHARKIVCMLQNRL